MAISQGLFLEPGFTDSPYMSAEQKAKVLRHWVRFLDSRFAWPHFTKQLYSHLTLHCSFIAHYDREGFYRCYFAEPDQTLEFLRQFDEDSGCRSVEYGTTYWLKDSPYADLNLAMVEAFRPRKAVIYEELRMRGRELAIAKVRYLIEKHDLAGVFKEGRARRGGRA